jgi:uncharacterized protein
MGAIGTLEKALAEMNRLIDPPADAKPTPIPALHRGEPMRKTPAPAARSNGHAPITDLPKGELACLTAIAQHPAGVTRQHLTVATGYKRSSRDSYVARLHSKNLIFLGDVLRPTDEGLAALGPDFEPLPTGAALRQHVLTTLPEGEAKVLEYLTKHYPDAVDRADIDQHSGYKRSSRDAYLSRLAARELITTEGRGTVRASAHLFD